jgi:DNA-binding transcriptional regulator YhcF (GntR family)
MAKKLSDLIGQFATIPNSFISASASLSTEAKWLFVILRYHTNSKTGNAFPSYTKIQEITGFHRKTIAKSLKELEAAGWLTKQRRFGATTIYALQIPSSSISDTTGPDSSSLNSTISSSTSATISSSDGVNTNQTEEETRSKEPDQGEEPLPLPFSTPDFLEAWKDYKQARKESRHIVTPTIQRALCKKMILWGEDRSIAALIHSTGYTGLFEPNGNGNGNNRHKPSASERRVDQLRANAEFLRSGGRQHHS